MSMGSRWCLRGGGCFGIEGPGERLYSRRAESGWSKAQNVMSRLQNVICSGDYIQWLTDWGWPVAEGEAGGGRDARGLSLGRSDFL